MWIGRNLVNQALGCCHSKVTGSPVCGHCGKMIRNVRTLVLLSVCFNALFCIILSSFGILCVLTIVCSIYSLVQL